MSYKACHAPYVKRTKRIENYFDTNSKFPLFRISLTCYFPLRILTSEFKTAEPSLRGQRAGGGIEFAIKIIACHSLSPSFSAMKTQRLAPSPCLSHKSQGRLNDFIHSCSSSISGLQRVTDIAGPVHGKS